MTRKHERESELDSRCRDMFIQHHDVSSKMSVPTSASFEREGGREREEEREGGRERGRKGEREGGRVRQGEAGREGCREREREGPGTTTSPPRCPSPLDPHHGALCWGSGCRVQGAGFRVQGSGYRVPVSTKQGLAPRQELVLVHLVLALLGSDLNSTTTSPQRCPFPLLP